MGSGTAVRGTPAKADAGATTAQGMRRKELLHLIRKAGREPIERDTLYRPVQRTESTFTVLV